MCKTYKRTTAHSITRLTVPAQHPLSKNQSTIILPPQAQHTIFFQIGHVAECIFILIIKKKQSISTAFPLQKWEYYYFTTPTIQPHISQMQHTNFFQAIYFLYLITLHVKSTCVATENLRTYMILIVLIGSAYCTHVISYKFETLLYI